MTRRLPVHMLDPGDATDGQTPRYDQAAGRVVWADGSAGGASLAVEDDGVEIAAAAGRINFTGDGVTVTDSGAGELQVNIPGGGSGSSGGWDSNVDLPLTSLTGWAPGTGTWTAEVDHIKQASTSAAANRLHYNTRMRLAEAVAQVDVSVDSVSNATYGRAGVFFGSPLATDGGGAHWISLNTDGTKIASIDFEVDAVAEYTNVPLTASIAHGTFATLRVHKIGNQYEVWVNGTLVSSYTLPAPTTPGDWARIGLKCYAAAARFRNLKFWTPTLP